MSFQNYYKGKRVLVTGHTGFKGAWLVKWLSLLGAEVTGVALEPEIKNSLHSILYTQKSLSHNVLDIRNSKLLKEFIQKLQPEVVFHLAAQALVRKSYEFPLETLETNVMGTANLLQAVNDMVKMTRNSCNVVVVTSDKCYENIETYHAYRESDRLGGHDVYSMSKGATELVASSWRRSFFAKTSVSGKLVKLATARAGNVIGGGDWCEDRIVVDCIKALTKNESIQVRNPSSIRPWQHVLEPLSGYLQLGCSLDSCEKEQINFENSFNFGPNQESARPVSDLCDIIIETWGNGTWLDCSNRNEPHEAQYLKLAIEKASCFLGWTPVWNFQRTVEKTIDWYRKAFDSNFDKNLLRILTDKQIKEYENDAQQLSLRWSID